MKKQITLGFVFVSLFAAVAGDVIRAQTNRDVGAAVKTAVAGIHVLRVRDNVYMLTGAGGNITVVTAPLGNSGGAILDGNGTAQTNLVANIKESVARTALAFLRDEPIGD